MLIVITAYSDSVRYLRECLPQPSVFELPSPKASCLTTCLNPLLGAGRNTLLVLITTSLLIVVSLLLL